MSNDEKEPEQMIREEDEYGNILVYPSWTKKNAPKDEQNKWEVPAYLWWSTLSILIYKITKHGHAADHVKMKSLRQAEITG